MIEAKPEQTLAICGDVGARYGVFVPGLDGCQSAAAKGVTLITEPED